MAGKIKRYVSDNARLMAEWDWEKNEKSPDQYTLGSNKKVWWKCDRGHEWQATISNRNHGTSCRYCSGHKVLIGFNDLQTVNPSIAKLWHPELNGSLKPTDVTANSGKKVWWLCSNGHSFQKSINEMNHGKGCIFCAGQKAIKGENDLETLNPELAEEWHPTKNGSLRPCDVLPHSNKSVWWKCKYNHEWEAKISKRSIGHGCPICQTFDRTSMPEFIIYSYIKDVFNDAINTYKEKSLGAFELDIFIPSVKVAIEYDGIWHILERDKLKDRICNKNGIVLIRVRSNKISLYNRNDPTFSWEENDYDDLTRIICSIFELLGAEIAYGFVDVKRDYETIFKKYHSIKTDNNLLEKYPSLAAEWHPTKNGDLKPENIPATTSSKKYWWKCSKCGYEWEAQLKNRINRIDGKNCPCCSGKVVAYGINDFETLYPKIAKEWHPTKNGDLSPKNVTKGSNKIVWWKCSICGGEWSKSVNKRTAGEGCPFCRGLKVLSGFNDLATKNPTLAAEWHPTKNGNLTPYEVTKSSSKNVWWKCSKCGFEWQNYIKYRSNGSGCPKCKKDNSTLTKGVKVKCLETDVVFNSITEAARTVNRTNSAINCCANGKTKTCGGYHWEYVK